MSSPAAVRGQEVRQRLLAAAAELIPERGWSAVSTRVLADRAGVTPSVVHYHFPSLSALLREAAIGVMRQVLDEVGALAEEAATPKGLIDTAFAAVDQYSGTDPASLLAVEAYLVSTRDDEMRAEIGDLVEEFRGRVERLLRAHRVRAPEVTAAVVAATIDGILLHRGVTTMPDTAEVVHVLHRLVD